VYRINFARCRRFREEFRFVFRAYSVSQARVDRFHDSQIQARLYQTHACLVSRGDLPFYDLISRGPARCDKEKRPREYISSSRISGSRSRGIPLLMAVAGISRSRFAVRNTRAGRFDYEERPTHPATSPSFDRRAKFRGCNRAMDVGDREL